MDSNEVVRIIFGALRAFRDDSHQINDVTLDQGTDETQVV